MQFSKLNFGELKVRVCYRSWKDIRTSPAYQVFKGPLKQLKSTYRFSVQRSTHVQSPQFSLDIG